MNAGNTALSQPLALMLRAVCVLCSICDRAARGWLVCTGCGMALLVATQVVFRYVFNDSLFWGEEAGRLLLVHLTFIGGGVAFGARADAGLDVVTARLTARARRHLRMAVVAAAFCFFSLMAYHGVRLMWLQRMQLTPAMGLSRMWTLLPLCAGFALGSLHALRQFIALALDDREHSATPPDTAPAGTVTPPEGAGR